MSVLYAVLTFIILIFVIGPISGMINMSQDFFAIWVIPSIVIGLLVSINQKLSILISRYQDETTEEIVSDAEIEKELENSNDEK